MLWHLRTWWPFIWSCLTVPYIYVLRGWHLKGVVSLNESCLQYMNETSPSLQCSLITWPRCDFFTIRICIVFPASKVTSLRRRIDGEIGHGDVTWTTSKWRARVGYPSTSISPYIFDRLSTIENDHIRPDNDLYWAPGYWEATIDLLIF